MSEIRDTEERLVIILNDDAKMSRGKRAAQAIHAALSAYGIYDGRPVVVLGGSSAEIAKLPFQVRDAGLTEVEPGTLTAGATFTTGRYEPTEDESTRD